MLERDAKPVQVKVTIDEATALEAGAVMLNDVSGLAHFELYNS